MSITLLDPNREITDEGATALLNQYYNGRDAEFWHDLSVLFDIVVDMRAWERLNPTDANEMNWIACDEWLEYLSYSERSVSEQLGHFEEIGVLTTDELYDLQEKRDKVMIALFSVVDCFIPSDHPRVEQVCQGLLATKQTRPVEDVDVAGGVL